MNRRFFIKTVSLFSGFLSTLGITALSKENITSVKNLTPLDKVNRISIINKIKNDIEQIAMTFVFELNNSFTWDKLTKNICFLLTENYVKMGLINEYKVVFDETTNTPETIDKGISRGNIAIQFPNSVEMYYIYCEVQTYWYPPASFERFRTSTILYKYDYSN